MNLSLPFIIETLVAILLTFTIGYCWLLNRRLERLRSSETAMKEIIAELSATTTAAERAIVNLRTAIVDCNSTLNERLEQAEHLSIDMSDQLRLGDDILKRISKIAVAMRNVSQPPAPSDASAKPSRAAATATAAEALVNRVRNRRTETGEAA